MKKVSAVVLVVVVALTVVLMGGFAFAQQDAKGCKDHPLFTRMPEYYIDSCEKKEFDAHEFVDPVTKQKVTVEGRLFLSRYYIKKEYRGQKSMLQVARNHTNAIEKIGGVFYMKNPDGSNYIYI